MHRYNGLGFRTMWQYDVDVDGTLEDAERYYFMHDERWRVIGTFRNHDEDPKEAFVHHAAGVGGFGGASYIDSIILRDADECDDWAAAGDGTLEERRYFCQNWRADVVAVTKSDGTPLEYVRYSSYGESTVYPVADLDLDGVVDVSDVWEWDLLYTEQAVAAAYQSADIDFDGEPGTADGDLFAESYTANTGLSGKGRLSSPSVGNRLGYAGYHHDPVTRLYDVRHRWYFPEIGRWGRRDPLGYVDGLHLYSYVRGLAILSTDWSGLIRNCIVGGHSDILLDLSDSHGLEVAGTMAAMGSMAGDTITEALKSCMKQKDMCLRYRCLELFYDSFNDLCGGCLSDKLTNLRTLIELWCTRGQPSKVTKKFCDSQYDAMKPFCDKCGSCKGSGQPSDAECQKAKSTVACYAVCIGWYQWFDFVCAKGPGGAADPNRHKEKIESMGNAIVNCAKRLARCGRVASE